MENSVPTGDASGYLITSLKPLNSSSELDESVPGLVKVIARKSELFDNPIYDRPSLELSGLVSSTENENYPSKIRDALYETTLESNLELSNSQNYSCNERSYDFIKDSRSQLSNKEVHQNYDKLAIQLDKNSNEVLGASTKKERHGRKAEEDSMLTVVNASYEALPCHSHSPKMVGPKPPMPKVLLATGQISDYEAVTDVALTPPELPGKKVVGFQPNILTVTEHMELSTAKSPSVTKTKN